MIEKIIDKHLEKRGMIKIPTSWTDVHREVVHKLEESRRATRELGREYNELLAEYAATLDPAKVKEALKSIDIDITGVRGKKLVQLYIDTFSVSFEDDYEEDV